MKKIRTFTKKKFAQGDNHGRTKRARIKIGEKSLLIFSGTIFSMLALSQIELHNRLRVSNIMDKSFARGSETQNYIHSLKTGLNKRKREKHYNDTKSH